MPIVDLTQKTEPEQEIELVAAVQSQSTQVFDLTQAPLLSVWLARLSESHSVLVLTSNHLVVDSWSLGLLLDELNVLYASRAQGLRAQLAPAMQFREYVQLLDGPDQRESRSSAEAYWLQQFADIPALVDLPSDFSRPATRTYSAGQERLWLGPDLWQMIRTASTNAGMYSTNLFTSCFQSDSQPADKSTRSGGSYSCSGTDCRVASAEERQRRVGGALCELSTCAQLLQNGFDLHRLPQDAQEHRFRCTQVSELYLRKLADEDEPSARP